MGHTFYQHDAHVVFHTGWRTIRESDRARLHAYIATLAISHKVRHVVIGGTCDHIHLLGNFPLDQAPADIVRGIKANSSRWLRGLNDCYADFAWQQGYGFFSVSASMRRIVVRYIENQERHHRKESAAVEYEKLQRLHEKAVNEKEFPAIYRV